jgi:hypothetical protein
VVDRDVDPIGVNAEIVLGRHPLPGKLDRLFLEVVPEGEVAQHLEERVVPYGVAHLLEIVVLPARPNTFLDRDRPAVLPLFQPLEDLLELHHPRVGEQQRRVAGRHQRRGRHLAMGTGLEIVDEGTADVLCLHGDKTNRGGKAG